MTTTTRWTEEPAGSPSVHNAPPTHRYLAYSAAWLSPVNRCVTDAAIRRMQGVRSPGDAGGAQL
jgi:hypothetical protein